MMSSHLKNSTHSQRKVSQKLTFMHINPQSKRTTNNVIFFKHKTQGKPQQHIKEEDYTISHQVTVARQ
jgi:hypothetical protein